MEPYSFSGHSQPLLLFTFLMTHPDCRIAAQNYNMPGIYENFPVQLAGAPGAPFVRRLSDYRKQSLEKHHEESKCVDVSIKKCFLLLTRIGSNKVLAGKTRPHAEKMDWRLNSPDYCNAFAPISLSLSPQSGSRIRKTSDEDVPVLALVKRTYRRTFTSLP